MHDYERDHIAVADERPEQRTCHKRTLLGAFHASFALHFPATAYDYHDVLRPRLGHDEKPIPRESDAEDYPLCDAQSTQA